MNIRGRPRWTTRWTGTVLWLLLLMALTLALSHSPWRYRVVKDSLLDNLDFSQAGRGWAGSGRDIRLQPGTPPVLMLKADGSGRNVIMSRLLPRSPKGIDRVRVSADLSSQDLQAGPAPWQRGRLILLSRDARGKRIWYWPQQVAELEGSRSWQRYQATIPLHPQAVQTWLVVYVSSVSGQLLLKNLELVGVTETGAYRAARAGIIGAWVLSGLWILLALVPTVRRSPPALFALIYALALFAGGLTPQPHLRDGLDSGRQSLEQLIATGAALFPVEIAPPDTGSTSRGQSPQSETKKETVTKDSGKEEAASTPSTETRGSILPPQLHIAGSDKRAHLAAFAGLSLILFLAFRSAPRRRNLLAALLLGAAIESLQALSITRESEWADLGYDAAGALLGAVFALLLLSLLPVRLTKVANTAPEKPEKAE